MKDDGTLTINIDLPDGTGAPVPPPEAVSGANSIHHCTNMGMTPSWSVGSLTLEEVIVPA
jgi:hypothetical protein